MNIFGGSKHSTFLNKVDNPPPSPLPGGVPSYCTFFTPMSKPSTLNYTMRKSIWLKPDNIDKVKDNIFSVALLNDWIVAEYATRDL